MKNVTIYCDGACSGNPGPGGYGTILVYQGHEKELSAAEAQTTNNRMELMGAIAGLELLREPCEVTLVSDSRYLCESILQGWVFQWEKNGWKKSDKKPALNIDLWERMLRQLRRHQVQVQWVKGHAGHAYNERCDQLAVQAYTTLKEKGRTL
ncbi:MAG: ribonuclease HI [Clostridiales bacterium]|nr:MAG: ribonuclease HI [Clostridiales bacterium]